MSFDTTPTSVVVAVTATCRRATELQRLVDALEQAGPALRALVVVDNGDDSATQEVASRSSLPVVYYSPGRNLGCGGGLRVGEEIALRNFADSLTHIWVLDDDAVPAADALTKLLTEMDQCDADLAHAFVVDSKGKAGWCPGLQDRAKVQAINSGLTPQEYMQRFGAGAVRFTWAQGIALLVRRKALDRHGLHRDDFWVRGEDLEFTLRYTFKGLGILVPSAIVAHIPPSSSDGFAQPEEYAKHGAMLQNIGYISLRLPHGRRIVGTLPGNLRRFFSIWGFSVRAATNVLSAIWQGAVMGRPAGWKMNSDATSVSFSEASTKGPSLKERDSS